MSLLIYNTLGIHMPLNTCKETGRHAIITHLYLSNANTQTIDPHTGFMQGTYLKSDPAA